MFATLVIALPSEHTGGDVVVQLRDEEQILRTQGLCDFGYSYLAWYADVNDSVSKVESLVGSPRELVDLRSSPSASAHAASIA